MALGRRRRLEYGDKKQSPLRIVLVLTILFIGAYFGYGQFLNGTLRKGDQAFAEGDFQTAARYYGKAAKLPLSGTRGNDGLGAVSLIQDSPEQAKSYFVKVLGAKPSRYGANPSGILEYFIGVGDFQNGDIYRDFLTNWMPKDKTDHFALHFAAISIGLRDLDAAEAHLRAAPISLKDGDRFNNLEKVISDFRTEGEIPVVLDTKGSALIAWNLQGAQLAFKQPQLFEGWSGNGDESLPDPSQFVAGLEEGDAYKQIQTTLDLNLQRAAAKAMEGYQGTMIIMEASTGALRAAYGTKGHNPFQTTFEPGSVVKILTYGTYVEDGGDISRYAPKKYPSYDTIGGKIFYDWTTHGVLETAEQGLAVSCNLMFAGMGIDSGWSRLKQVFDVYFGGAYNLGLQEGNLGEVTAVPDGAWELGRAAIGLDAIRASVLGLVKIPATVANDGMSPAPHLLDHYGNYLGQRTPAPSPPQAERVFSKETAQRLRHGMVEAVYFEKGTARRAKTDYVHTAMKTGTAGDKPYDSIMVGMFPAENTKIVFAFYLDKGGKCEINGGKVAKALQEHIKALAPEYLE